MAVMYVLFERESLYVLMLLSETCAQGAFFIFVRLPQFYSVALAICLLNSHKDL
jgi:hypothetical protein